jgi:hypothetical protein
MIPLNKNLSNQLIDSVSINQNDNNNDGNNIVLSEHKLQSIKHNEDQKAYETILQKLQESNEEWWLVSSENEVKGYAYRKRLPSKK